MSVRIPRSQSLRIPRASSASSRSLSRTRAISSKSVGEAVRSAWKYAMCNESAPSSPGLRRKRASSNRDKSRDRKMKKKIFWETLFRECATCGRLAVAEERIEAEDISDQEPYLYLGLPGLCLLDLAQRSLVDGVEAAELLFLDGKKLNPVTLPKQDGALRLFETMLHAKEELRAANLDPKRMGSLRTLVLQADGDVADDAEVARLGSLFQSIATELSQLQVFKAKFQTVLDELGDDMPEQ